MDLQVRIQSPKGFSGAARVRCKPVDPDAWEMPETPKNRPVFWLIDKSGSMYSVMTEMNAALVEGIIYAMQIEMDRPYIMPFNHKCALRPMSKFVALRAEGQTDFVNAFMALMKCVDHMKVKCKNGFDLMFFTDGCDHTSSYTRSAFLREIFMPFLAAHKASLHVIGFGRYHDVKTMQNLVVGAPPEVNTSYQYAATKAMFSEVLMTVMEQCALHRSGLSLDIGGFKLRLSKEDLTHPTWSFVSSEAIDVPLREGRDTIVCGCSANRRDVVATFERDVEEEDQFELLRWKIECADHRIKREFKLHVAGGGPESFTEIGEALRQLMSSTLFRMPKEQRKVLIGRIADLKDRMSSWRKLLLEGATQSSRAAMLQMAHAPSVCNARLRRRVEERCLAGSGLGKEVKECVQRESEMLRKEPVDDGNLAQPPEDWTCLLSTSNYKEAMLDEDCICVTCSVRRSGISAAADPRLLRIESVNAQCMTIDMFRECLGALIDKDDGVVNYDPSQKAGTVIRDRVLLPCNAVFPLWLDERHWMVARHYMKLALGWMTGGDERCYSGEQWRAIPFLMHAWTLAIPSKSSISLKYHHAIADTAIRMLPKAIDQECESLFEWANASPREERCNLSSASAPNLAIPLAAISLLCRRDANANANTSCERLLSLLDGPAGAELRLCFLCEAAKREIDQRTKHLTNAETKKALAEEVTEGREKELYPNAGEWIRPLIREIWGDEHPLPSNDELRARVILSIFGVRRVEAATCISDCKAMALKIVMAGPASRARYEAEKDEAWNWFLDERSTKLPSDVPHYHYRGFAGKIIQKLRKTDTAIETRRPEIRKQKWERLSSPPPNGHQNRNQRAFQRIFGPL